MVRSIKQRFLAEKGRDLPSALAHQINIEEQVAGANEDRAELDSNSTATSGVKTRHSTSKRVVTSKKPDIGKMKGKQRDSRAERGRNKEKKQSQRKQAASRAPSEHLTFSPDDKTRAKMVKVLKRKPSNLERKELEIKLTREFLRMYKRRRHEVQPDYEMLPQERKHAMLAATLCIHRRVTPSQLIGYWVEHVGDFTGMKFPALNFLAVVGNVDRVSVEVMVGPAKKPKSKRRGPEVHAYSGALDPGLRPGLIDAGLMESGEFSDRFLMTIQTTAQALSQGRRLFVSAKLKPLVRWAVEHLYSE